MTGPGRTRLRTKMRQREFVTLGGAWVTARDAHAQQPVVSVIGSCTARPCAYSKELVRLPRAFAGENMAIEYLRAESQ
jgi:hypothetical protein